MSQRRKWFEVGWGSEGWLGDGGVGIRIGVGVGGGPQKNKK